MKRTIGAIAAATATFTAAVGLVTTGGWLISMAALQPPLLHLEVAIVSVRAFGIARGSFRWVERVVSHDAALHDTVDRRAMLWDALAAAGPHGAWALRRGDAVTRLMQDAEVLQDRLTRVIVPAAAALVTGLGAVLLQSRLNPWAGLAFLAALLVAGVLVPLLAHRIEHAAARSALHERARLNAAISDLVSHRDELRVLGIAGDTLDDVAASDGRRLAIEGRAALLTGATQWLALMASGLAVLAGLLAAVPAVLEGRLPGTHLAVVALLPWSAAEVIAALAAAASVYVRVRAAEARLAEVGRVEAAIPALLEAEEDGLTVRDLDVVWANTPVTHAVSLQVRPGERVALVGPSGGGKSSVLSAILGFAPYRGTVAVGGADGRPARAASITAVPQAPHMFRTTVRENLRLAAGPVDDPALMDALRAVGLEAVPLERDLGEAPLSGGEAQRLGLARALLSGAPVLLLDEPTEHLDEETARQVLASIRTASRGRALLMTTHRLEDLRDFDRIHVLEAGSIICSGTFDECLAESEWFRDAVGWRLDKVRVD